MVFAGGHVKRKAPKEIAAFRVYPGLGNYECGTGRRGIYFVVRVLGTFSALREIATADGTECHPASFYRKANAACQCWLETARADRGRKYVTRNAGQILICTKDLSPAVIAHECVHAANWWFRRLKKIARNRPIVVHRPEEEMVCYAIGEMTDQVYRGLERVGLIRCTT